MIPPWNFPIAIPTGGVAAALACGNTVLFKPSPLAFPLGAEIAKCFWEAGIPREALQLVCCEDGEPIQTLSGHPDVDAIIFTGGTQTALKLLEKRPDAELSAETGGKNATIVTAMADRDQTIEHVYIPRSVTVDKNVRRHRCLFWNVKFTKTKLSENNCWMRFKL